MPEKTRGKASHGRTLKRAKAALRAKNQLTIPETIRKALQAKAGDDLTFEVREDGTVTLTATRVIRADQAWFWSEDWQKGEREADGELSRGEGVTFTDPEDMFAEETGD